MQEPTSPKIDKLVASGQLMRAERQIRRQISASTEVLSRQRLVTQLIHVHVKQSRYKEAFVEAQRLDEGLNYRRLPFFLTLWLAFIVSLVSRVRFAKIDLRVQKFMRKMLRLDPRMSPYAVVEGVLWGVYWQDMRKALHANLLCVLLADHDETRLKSLAFLNYTLAYQGWSRLGLSGMTRVISIFELNGFKDHTRDLLVWLGVAYQMGARPRECLATHAKLASRHSEAEAFHQIISFASRLHMSATELGPVETAAALEQSFSGSFALKESRNHIQIYGTKAALLALEGRREEAITFLQKAEMTAQRNENRLDNIIFNRFAAITFLNLKEPTQADVHICEARKYLRLYADVALYFHELARLEAVSSYLKNPALLNRWLQILKFTACGMLTLNGHLFRKTLRLSWQFVYQPELSYWSSNQCSLYLRDRIRALTQSNQHAVGEKISLNLTRALLKIDFEKVDQIGPNDLVALVKEIFSSADVFVGRSLDECLSQVQNDFGLSASFILNDETDQLQARCEDGRYLVAVRAAAFAPTQEQIAVGVVVSDVDFVSQEMIEASLRITLTLYHSLSMSFNARQERLTNQHQLEIAKMAAQVAHDIRSPLSALTMLASFATELSDEKRALVRDASRRISDIANHLLKKSKEKAIEASATGPATSDVLIAPLIESIVSEKRSLEKVADRIDIHFASTHPLGLFARINATEIQRALSNVLNNSIEAIEGPGRIALSLRADDANIFISIADTGKGMSAATLARLGDRGFSSGKSGESSGFGLGLHHALATLKNAGGKLEFKSQLSAGTTVEFVIPRISAPHWFASEIHASDFEEIWSVDDDVSIHQVWSSRFANASPNVPLVLLRSVQEFVARKAALEGSIARILVLMDCDFDNETTNGLDLIVAHSLQDQAILVTSRSDDPAIVQLAAVNRIRILPKSEMHLVQIT